MNACLEAEPTEQGLVKCDPELQGGELGITDLAVIIFSNLFKSYTTTSTIIFIFTHIQVELQGLCILILTCRSTKEELLL